MILERWKQAWRAHREASLPANVWAEAFTLGFSKAWDMMAPLMTDGVRRMEETIRTQAIEETLARLAPSHRIVEAENYVIRSRVDLLKKRDEFRQKQEEAQGAEGEKYRHYVQALEWALQATNGH